MALQTKLERPSYANASWDWAVKHGTWTILRGKAVLQLGASDYVLAPVDSKGAKAWAGKDVLYSVNADSANEWNALPFGIRWAVTTGDIERDSYGTPLDRLAVEQFRLRGLI